MSRPTAPLVPRSLIINIRIHIMDASERAAVSETRPAFATLCGSPSTLTIATPPPAIRAVPALTGSVNSDIHLANAT